MSEREWVAEASARGERLDRHVAEVLDEPRNQVQRWIREGRVRLDERVIERPSHRLEGGERLHCSLPPPPVVGPVAAEEGELAVLYEDADLVVVDKPAELTVHPGAGRPDRTLANRLLHRYPEMVAAGSPERPGIVHRLDRDTTGVMVVARTPAAYRALTRAFAGREVEKTYLAVVWGRPEPRRDTIEAPIGRHPRDRTRMTVRAGGRPSRTDYRVLATTGEASFLQLELHTGRTHQIRVHLKHLGHPLLGDPVYGEARWRPLAEPRRSAARDFPRPALHAWRLAFRHPGRDDTIEAIAPLPADLTELWRQLSGEEPPTPQSSSRSGR